MARRARSATLFWPPDAPGLPMTARALPVLAALLALPLGLALGAGPKASAESHPLLGKPSPPLSGRATFSPGLINLNKLQNEFITERGPDGKPLREGNRIKVRVIKHALVLNFFATYCVPCIQEIPTFNRVAKAYEGRPVKFVYVNVDTEKTANEVRDFARAKGIEVEMMLPSVRYTLEAFKIDALPRIMVLSADGVIVHVILGFQDDLAAQLDSVLVDVVPPASARNGAGRRAG
jgi:thiol-disulfide isomerase/thioredoxin